MSEVHSLQHAHRYILSLPAMLWKCCITAHKYAMKAWLTIKLVVVYPGAEHLRLLLLRYVTEENRVKHLTEQVC